MVANVMESDEPQKPTVHSYPRILSLLNVYVIYFITVRCPINSVLTPFS